MLVVIVLLHIGFKSIQHSAAKSLLGSENLGLELVNVLEHDLYG
jgi:hypothetical protein